jgi:hypothetical protein
MPSVLAMRLAGVACSASKRRPITNPATAMVAKETTNR